MLAPVSQNDHRNILFILQDMISPSSISDSPKNAMYPERTIIPVLTKCRKILFWSLSIIVLVVDLDVVLYNGSLSRITETTSFNINSVVLPQIVNAAVINKPQPSQLLQRHSGLQ